MVSCQVVFNLYPFSDTLYLPSANIVQADRSGELTHLVQRAVPATIGAYGIALTPVLERLFQQIERLSPKALEEKFRAPKAKSATPLAQLLAQPETRGPVSGYIHRELDIFFTEIAAHRLPITLDAERRTLAKDVQLQLAAEPLVPHLSFRKSETGIEYRFQLGTETEKWNIRDFDAFPLTNTDPAWVAANYTLFRVPGINGNMLRPFREKDALQIPPGKVHSYFRQFIAKNARRTQIEAEGFAVSSTDQLLAVEVQLTEHILEKTWLLKAEFVYDGARFYYGENRDRVSRIDIPDEDTQEISVQLVCRNPAAEQAAIDRLLALGLEEAGRLFRLPAGPGLEEQIDWLARRRPILEAAGCTVLNLEVDGRELAVLPAELELMPSAGPADWFEVHGLVRLADQTYPFRAFVPYLRSRNPYFPLADGRFFLIPETWFARYGELAGALREDGEALRLPKTLFTLLPGDPAEQPDNFPLIDPEQVDFHPPADLRAQLRPYQLLGVKWLVGHYRQGFGACLADDMGLGKTLQTIAVLLHIKMQGVKKTDEEDLSLARGTAPQLSLFQTYQEALRPLRALVVLPASLVFNWQRELELFAPSLFVYAHTGPKRLRDIRAIAGHDVVLTTYHTARQDLKLLEQLEWGALVLDESQQIKNRESEVSKVVRSLRGQFKLSLSGTPIENSLADLWTQMEFINPDTLGSFPAFQKEFLWPIEKRGDAAARERLFSRVRPFFLRRTKEAVAPELPGLTDQVFYSEMLAEQQKLYERTKSAARNEILNLFDDPKTRFMALQALTRLRQLANHPALTDSGYSGGSGKFDDVLAQWETLRRAGHKVLFFSSFEQHLQLFRRVFDEKGWPYAWLTGETAAAKRGAVIERFQSDRQTQAFFMTIKAGGVGLNLTAADYVFLLDPWWNPAVEEQAIARAYRIGQTRPVTALRFIAHETIEEKIRQLQERKKQLGADFFAAGAEQPAWTREDVEMLLT